MLVESLSFDLLIKIRLNNNAANKKIFSIPKSFEFLTLSLNIKLFFFLDSISELIFLDFIFFYY